MKRPEFLDHPPEKQPKMKLPDFIVKEYYRTMTSRATKGRVGYPDYLLAFEEPYKCDTEGNMAALKNGEYDLHKEEILL